jgi:hypothetical protein
MVQQQFIISELNNESENSSEHESSIAPERFDKIQDEIEVPRDQPDYNPGEESKEGPDLPYSRGFGANKVSFAIFGSFKNQFVIEDSPQYKRYIAACQSGFRVMGMIKPDYYEALVTFLSSEGFRNDANELRDMIINFFKLFNESTNLKIAPNYRDYWSICQVARIVALKYLDDQFIPIDLDFSMNKGSKNVGSSSKAKVERGFTLFDSQLKEKQVEVRLKVEQYAVKEALDIWSRAKYMSMFLVLHQQMEGDPDEKFNYCLSKAKKD